MEQCWAGLHSWLLSVVFLAWPYREATLQPGTACIVCLEVSACKQQAVLIKRFTRETVIFSLSLQCVEGSWLNKQKQQTAAFQAGHTQMF